ncbi:MAG TPA: c-type cytochrome biogenesis protein CcsB, partial [Acidothermaceae bacterium]|nr:c-type cytochrome biogenesis protein CcsB [Acidothermaceae bacterium]
MGVDVGLARLSNELIAGGIAAYSLGFLAYAVDAAFGNHAPQLPGEKTARFDVRVPALVGAARTDAGDATELLPPSSSGSDAPVEGSFLAAHVGRFAIAITVVGWLLQGGAIVSRGLSVHRLPWGNMYEFTLALTFTAVTAFLVIMMRQPARYLGVFVMTPVVLALGIAVLVLYVAPAPLVPALHSYWL